MDRYKYNAEGYYDPTAYQAIKNITREEKAVNKDTCKKSGYFRPLVYICSPFAGDVDKNIDNARDFSRFAIARNCIPIAPHLLFPQFLDDSNKQQRELGIFMGLVLMSKCRELWCFGSKISNGMAIELKKAKKRKMVIRYFNEKCEEVMNI